MTTIVLAASLVLNVAMALIMWFPVVKQDEDISREDTEELPAIQRKKFKFAIFRTSVYGPTWFETNDYENTVEKLKVNPQVTRYIVWEDSIQLYRCSRRYGKWICLRG